MSVVPHSQAPIVDEKDDIMHASAFMIPAAKVVKCSEWDPIEKVLKAVIENKISGVVVLGKDEQPVGIVTKTDLVEAYSQDISLHQKIGLIMTKDVKTVLSTQSRDQVASAMEHNHTHHCVVVDGVDGKFVGLVSAWDVVAECARDARAWPWSRTDDGRVHPIHPMRTAPAEPATTPATITEVAH